MDAGVFATVLFAIAQVRHRLRFQLDTGGGKRNAATLPQTKRRRTGAAHTKRC